MNLSDFEYLVKFKYQVKSNEEVKDLSLTEMFLKLTGITYLQLDGKAADIDTLLDSFETDEEKEAFLDKLAWHIPGGDSMSDPKYDVDKDTKLSKEDIKEVENIAAKEEPTEEEIAKADMNKDEKVDETDVKIIKSKVKVESSTTTASTAEDVEAIENPEDTNLTVDSQEAVDAITGDDYYNNLNIEG